MFVRFKILFAQQYYAYKYAKEQAAEKAKTKALQVQQIDKPTVSEVPKEEPGIYFDLKQFFDTTPLPVATFKNDLKAFVDEVKYAVSVMLRIGEPLRGRDRQEFTNVLSCLGNNQTLLNSI